MSLKRNHNVNVAFSMASMTDIIFLLLIFFMVTSTFVFPTALDVNLPQSSRQTAIKPSLRIYIDNNNDIYKAEGENGKPEPIEKQALATWIKLMQQQGEVKSVALYADETVPYGSIVEVLNAGQTVGVKIVLATRPVSTIKVKKYLK